MSLLPPQIGRRTFVLNTGVSLGSMALASLVGRGTQVLAAPSASTNGQAVGALGQLHYAPRAKRIIWLYMAGGMSHLDTFDHKPKLEEMNGQPMPESVTKGQQIAQLQGAKLRVLGPQHPFQKWGESGQTISAVWPLLGSKCADEMCIVRSLFTEAINHDPAHTFMNTGTMNSGRPAMGSWLWYGLGNDAESLPGFVVMVSTGNFGQKQPIAARQWHSGFLPSRFQGVEFRSTGDPVLYLKNPSGINAARQRDFVDSVEALNQLRDQTTPDPEVATRISQYEMAFRMQTSVPDLMNVSDEPKHVLDLYGTSGGDGTFAANCLLARRLVERGVRFIQLYHRDWDHHGAVKQHIAGTAAEVDRGVAALIVDLKRRGLLDDTIIVFGSEFGRTPMAQGDGRDHHLAGFTMWFAGGGFKGGTSFGATDELGYRATENRVSVHDVHATLLHLLGIDHMRFSVKSQGLDSRLTGVEPARVVNEILA
ncbi:MAG: DUF1501 domain-containing protein [Planctomycetaceae bacterium]